MHLQTNMDFQWVKGRGELHANSEFNGLHGCGGFDFYSPLATSHQLAHTGTRALPQVGMRAKYSPATLKVACLHLCSIIEQSVEGVACSVSVEAKVILQLLLHPGSTSLDL